MGWAWLASVALLLMVAACATASPRGTNLEEVTLEVRNDLVPGRAVTIRAVSSSGARQLIGALSPGQNRALTFRQPNFLGAYWFVAEVDGDGEIVSTRVPLSAGERVVWALRSNLLRFIEGTEREPGQESNAGGEGGRRGPDLRR